MTEKASDLAKAQQIINNAYAEKVTLEEKLAYEIKIGRQLRDDINVRVNRNAELGRELDDTRALAQDVLACVLARPNAVLKLYGQEFYQHAKDAYVKLGGDGAALPMPTPEPQKAPAVVEK